VSARRPYMRSMDGWWRRDPFFIRYMVREATAVLVVAYAAVLLLGVIRLAQGESAYERWLAALHSPWSLSFHLVLFAGLVYHTWSWFEIMPKTMPSISIGGKKLQPTVITATGLVAAAFVSLVLLLLLLGIGS
jgi:fumarate reductase subunit C